MYIFLRYKTSFNLFFYYFFGKNTSILVNIAKKPFVFVQLIIFFCIFAALIYAMKNTVFLAHIFLKKYNYEISN